MKEKQSKKYLIALEERNSKIALVAGILVFFCTIAAIMHKFEKYPVSDSIYPLQYFTVLSNFLSAVGAAFMIPYAVEGIRKKRFYLPRWVVLFQFSGATCVAITFLSTLALILPTQGMSALKGSNFWLHVVTPFCTVVLFQCVETGVVLSCKNALLCLAPYWAYMVVYYVMAVIVGEGSGGWRDFYLTQAFWPAWISTILMLAVGFVVSAILRAVQNRRAKQFWKRAAAAWSADLEPVQILIEAFGLGRFIGAKCPFGELTVPVDIFNVMSEKYGIPMDRLTKAYVKGALDAMEERKEI